MRNNFKISFKWIFGSSMILIVLGIVILINVVVSFSNYKLDMTEDQRYSLSNEAKSFLENVKELESTLFFEVYLEGDLPSELRGYKELIKEKLENFKEYSNNKIDYVFVDPKSDVNDEFNDLEKEIFNNRKGLFPIEPSFKDYNGESKYFRIWPGAKLSYNDNGITKETFIQLIPPAQFTDLEILHNYVNSAIVNLEYKLASGIRELIKKNKKRIAFLQGHNELKPQQTAAAKRYLNKHYYFSEVTINDSINKLDEFDALIIADPKSYFSDKDLFVIDQFVMRGGKLMVFMNTLDFNQDSLDINFGAHTIRKRIRLEDMLFDYGIKIHENFVMDANCMLQNYNFANSNIRVKTDKSNFPQLYHVVATSNSHPISRNLNRIAMNFINQISFTKEDEVESETIITSSSNSTVSRQAPLITYNDFKRFGTPLNLNQSQLSNFALGGVIKGKFKSYFVDKPWEIDTAYTNNPDARFLKESKNSDGQIMVIGNGQFLSNSIDSMKLNDGTTVYMTARNHQYELDYVLPKFQYNNSYKIDNSTFFQNIIDYMLDDLSIINLRNKEIKLKELDREKISTEKGFYTILNIVLPILLIISSGFVLVWLRKKRYSKT